MAYKETIKQIDYFSCRFSETLFERAAFSINYELPESVKKDIYSNPTQYLLNKYNKILPKHVLIKINNILTNNIFVNDEEIHNIIIPDRLKEIKGNKLQDEIYYKHLFITVKNIFQTESLIFWESFYNIFIDPTLKKILLIQEADKQENLTLKNTDQNKNLNIDINQNEDKNIISHLEDQTIVYQRGVTINILKNWVGEIEAYLNSLEEKVITKQNNEVSNIFSFTIFIVVIFAIAFTTLCFSLYKAFVCEAIITTRSKNESQSLLQHNNFSDIFNNETILDIGPVIRALCKPYKRSEWYPYLVTSLAVLAFITILYVAGLFFIRFIYHPNGMTYFETTRAKRNPDVSSHLQKLKNLDMQELSSLQVDEQTIAEFLQALDNPKMTINQAFKFMEALKTKLQKIAHDLEIIFSQNFKEPVETLSPYQQQLKTLNLSNYKSKGVFSLPSKANDTVIDINTNFENQEKEPLLTNNEGINVYGTFQP